MNENTLEEIWRIKASMFSGIVLVLLFAFFLISITSIIIIATPIRYYLPGYLDAEVREKALRSAIKADSLQQQLDYQEAYIRNLHGIFNGTRSFDSVKVLDTISISHSDPLLQKTDIEKDYVKQYEEEERYNLSVLSPTVVNPVEGLVFYKPVKGIVINKFDPNNKSFGVVLNTAPKETVLATLDGVVMSSGYNINTGYTMQIQHKNGFISVYKNNSLLLKNTGDKVRTGEAIAVLEESEEKNKQGQPFIFELWYKGSAVNPEKYISF